MRTRVSIAILTAVLGICLLASLVLASSNQNHQILWWTVDGGGGISSGDNYRLMVTIGQHDTGIAIGGQYTLSAGFWPGIRHAAPMQHTNYLPLVLK